VSATRDGAQCAVTVTPAAAGGIDARPLAIVLSDSCTVTEDKPQLHPAVASLDGPPPLQLATSIQGPSAALPEELFAPPPDTELQPPQLPKAKVARDGCGCTSVGRPSSFGSGGALALLATILLAARRLARERAGSGRSGGAARWWG
jgi:hypothetical protein